MIHCYELDIFGKLMHKCGPEIVIHSSEIEIFSLQIHKCGPQILIYHNEIVFFWKTNSQVWTTNCDPSL